MNNEALLEAVRPFVDLNRELENRFSDYPHHSILFGSSPATVDHGNFRQLDKAYRAALAAAPAPPNQAADPGTENQRLSRENERLRWRHPNVIPEWNDLPGDLRVRLAAIARQYTDEGYGGDFAVHFYAEMRKILNSAPPHDPPRNDAAACHSTQRDQPAGYRQLHAPLLSTEKAVRFRYYKWLIWIPIKALVRFKDGSYAAPAWAIDSAKEHESAERISD